MKIREKIVEIIVKCMIKFGMTRICPEIKIDGIKGKSYYNPMLNDIYLSTFLTEDQVIRALVHEITHWSQFMFLDYEDMKLIQPSYKAYMEAERAYENNEIDCPPMHIIERHAYLISDVWSMEQ
jgi:hypothetical protein